MKNFPASPVNNWIAVDILDKGLKITQSGLIQLNDDMKKTGIRPRWAKVLATGSNVYKEGDIEAGDFLLLEHLGWTRPMKMEIDDAAHNVYWTIPEKVILIADPEDINEKYLPSVSGPTQ